MARNECINDNDAKNKPQRKRKIQENSSNVYDKGSDSPSGKFRRLSKILNYITQITFVFNILFVFYSFTKFLSL